MHCPQSPARVLTQGGADGGPHAGVAAGDKTRSSSLQHLVVSEAQVVLESQHKNSWGAHGGHPEASHAAQVGVFVLGLANL